MMISHAAAQRRDGRSRVVIPRCAFAPLRERSFFQTDHTPNQSD